MNKKDIEKLVYSNADIVDSLASQNCNSIDKHFDEVDKEIFIIYIHDDIEENICTFNIQTLEFKIMQIKTLDELVDWLCNKLEIK